MELQRTSLYDQHISLKAKMSPFAGFDMPVQYSSVKEEVIAVRESAGVFDVSHMGEFFVEGDDAVDFVDFLIPNDFAGAEIGKAVYSPLCRDNGTMIDDLICYKLAEDRVLICVNAANVDKDWSWIKSKHTDYSCRLTNLSHEYSLLALQGPKSEHILTKLGAFPEDNIEYYGIREVDFDGEKIILARTGYTGEDGFELFCSHSMANRLWVYFMEIGVAPCGLASRDVLRLEVCYPLYGHELNDELTPLDSALNWTVKLNKETFIGKDALEKYTPKYRLVKLSLDKGIPREGYPILNGHQQPIGKVTSGTMSVILGRGVALGLIQKDLFPEDKKFFISIRNRNFEANYHAKPFVTGGHK